MIVALGDGSFRRWDISTGKERPIAQPKLEKTPDPAVVPPAAAEVPALPPVPHTARLAAYSRDGLSKAIVRTIPGKSIKLANGEIRYDRSSPKTSVIKKSDYVQIT